MSLPTLVDYAVPDELPASKAGWSVDPARAALLVHDLQRYFVRPFAPDSPVLQATLRHTAELLERAHELAIPVFYTAQTGTQSEVVRGLQADLWGPGMQPTPEHTEIVPAVAPSAGDVVLVKHRYSAFAHSDLAEQMAAAGRDQLVITGVYAHIGITATAFDGFQREIQPFVVADAVADFSPESHQRALEQVASCSGVVTTTRQVLSALAATELTETEKSAPVQNAIDTVVRAALAELVAADVVEAAFADPDADLFELGLDSVRAFDLLDALAEAGVEIDFGEFSREARISFIRTSAATIY